jgi:serine/threonine-protein phosphatase 5
LFELLRIFELNGYPDENHLYLFNGDFVDRGPCSIEVAVILYAYKLLYPKKFFINRGNHEMIHEHVGDEFKKECVDKYGGELGHTVLATFLSSFQCLPLATVIGQKYLVVHGGPSVDPDFTLDNIRALKIPGDESDLKTQLLWNDPVKPEETSKSSRGGGKLFKPNVVDDFLKKEGLSWIIRSHESRMADGHKADGKCLTGNFTTPLYSLLTDPEQCFLLQIIWVERIEARISTSLQQLTKW